MRLQPRYKRQVKQASLAQLKLVHNLSRSGKVILAMIAA